ncbi:uncharacterized protein LOC126740868 [Anthonomus grandis grandis]|uniref:uncharacterized protein LOC126740868 n=1 Tax=Anthonomus grandis grandis TaxID=2921223 RepID=UPI0021665727|nr:uncharacterized protein LOC126740868 [Anthonomus grandis grandis]
METHGRQQGKMFRRCGETGSFRDLRIREGGQNGQRWRQEPAIMKAVREDRSRSTRRNGAALRIHHSTVHRVLKKNNLHPFHLKKVQELLPVDSEHDIRVNVWIGLMRARLFEPVILPDRLNSNKFSNLLNNDLVDFLEEISLAAKQELWFQMDGCPAHNGRIVQNSLNQCFGEKWIGRYGPVRWPPRSPDLTALDFYVWGTLKSNVYSININTRDELINRMSLLQ